MCQIWLRSDSRVEKKLGVQTDRQTKKTAALYIVDYIWIILQYEHGITQFTTEYIDVCFKTHTKWDDLLNTVDPYINFYKHTRVTVVNSICSDSIITMLYFNELKRDRSCQVSRLSYIVITGNVGLFLCCFSFLIGRIQSTFAPTEDCTRQQYVSRM